VKVYLDIETDRKGNICVIGMFKKPDIFVQLHGPDITTDDVEKFTCGATTIVTFNGDCFDLPVIKKFLNLDLMATHQSHDLFKVKKKLGIKGGLKELEKMFGIERKTEGVDGYQAIWLWESYVRNGKGEALNLLLQYNREDVINLIPLEEKFNQLRETHHD
jgi:uncharacterized protein